MKKLILIVPIVVSSVFAKDISDDKVALIQEYKHMFSKIKEKRIGADESKIDALRKPFIEVKNMDVKKSKSEVKKSKIYILQAIFGNRAKIGGKWYALGEMVEGMKVVAIKSDHVWLRNNKFRKKIIMGSKNEKISIK